MFITLEGIEGCGKSTQAQRLGASLPGALLTREPGSTALGVSIRELLLHPAGPRPVPAAEALLFFADRAQHVQTVVRPALAEGAIVLCDRFSDSTLAYQGYGRGLPLASLRVLAELATDGLWPHLTVLLDIDVVESSRRVLARGGADRLEAETRQFHERVRAGYAQMAAADPGRWVVVDGAGREEEVAARVRDAVVPRLVRRP